MRLNARYIGYVAGFWLVVGLIHVTGGFLSVRAAGQDVELIQVVRTLVIWFTWAPATLLVVPLVRRVPVRRDNWWIAVPIHVVGAAGISFLLCLLVSLLTRVVPGLFEPPQVSYGAQVQRMFANSIADDGVIYLALLVAVLAFDAHRAAARARLRTQTLDRRLAEAKLHALNMQIQPHFLANALQNIASLIDQGRHEEASDLSVALGTLFRRMTVAGSAEHRLEAEIDFVRQYLSVERARFGERLDVQIFVQQDAGKAVVPRLILQPLVENAIRHGFEPTAGPGRVAVRAIRENGTLTVTVSDTGQGIDRGGGEGGGDGVGLSNTRSRLEAVYGPDNYTFQVRPGSGGGTVASITVPFRSDESV